MPFGLIVNVGMPLVPRLARRFAVTALALACGGPLGISPAASMTPALTVWENFDLLDRSVAPGTRQRITLLLTDSIAGSPLDTQVLVARGRRPGPTLCVTAGVHGDEINGVEIARRVFAETSDEELAGTLLIVPIVNVPGFRNGSRYLPDRRDLNRNFPGSPSGSTASRVAASLFTQIVRRCDALVDLHTGSLRRRNLPQVRADCSDARVLELASSFDPDVVVHSTGLDGTLRRAALGAGVPAILYEAGGPLRFEAAAIDRGVRGVRSVMGHFGMLGSSAGAERRATEPLVFFRSRWSRANTGGIFITKRRLGEYVVVGEVLGTITDPLSDEREEIVAVDSGYLIGMAVPQVVLPGFALFHVGIGAPAAGVDAPLR